LRVGGGPGGVVCGVFGNWEMDVMGLLVQEGVGRPDGRARTFGVRGSSWVRVL
jgi:hypothetical protein